MNFMIPVSENQMKEFGCMTGSIAPLHLETEKGGEPPFFRLSFAGPDYIFPSVTKRLCQLRASSSRCGV